MNPQDGFRAAIAARNEAANRARDLRDRAARLASDVDLAEREDDDAARVYSSALAAKACGEAADVDAARERRDLAVEHLAELRTTFDGVKSRLAESNAKLEAEQKYAARAQRFLCVDIAGAKEAELRAAADAFGAAWRAWMRMAKTARAAAVAEGFPGDPIVVGGPGNLLIRGGGLTDDGLRGILARHGVTVGTLQIGAQPDDVLTEAGILSEADAASDAKPGARKPPSEARPS